MAISKEIIQDFNDWIKSDNVVKIDFDLYVEQTTQYRKQFTKEELLNFFIKEFIN